MPEVSVIVPAYYSHATIESCLASLERQTFRDFETIVVDSTPDEQTVALVRGRFPAVVVHHASHRLLPHEARNEGASRASGVVLTFTDPDCVASAEWLAVLAAAHRDGHPVVGGAIGTDGGWWSRAVHMTKFAWWLPGGAPSARPDIATANASYARAVWDAVGPFHGARFAGDSDMNWRVRARGGHVWFEPRAIVRHTHMSGPLAFVRERFRRGLDFGRTRVERRAWSRARCVAYIALSPLLPAVMLARAGRYAAASGQAGEWAITLPVQMAGHAAWCAGEAVAHAERVWAR